MTRDNRAPKNPLHHPSAIVDFPLKPISSGLGNRFQFVYLGEVMDRTNHPGIIDNFSLSSYAKVGRLLHLMTALELVLFGLVLSNPAISFKESFGPGLFFNGAILSFFAALPILGQLDARSRYQNYKQIKDQLLLYGFDKRILRPTLKSRCLRDAALVAADELGHGDRCRAHFHSCGYRWYHLLPEFVFQSPHFLLSRTFWRTTFFAPAYQTRFNAYVLANRLNPIEI